MAKVKSKNPDFERGNAKVVTIPIVIGTGIHKLKYSEDYNLKRDAAFPAISSRHSLSDGGSLRRPSSAVACLSAAILAMDGGLRRMERRKIGQKGRLWTNTSQKTIDKPWNFEAKDKGFPDRRTKDLRVKKEKFAESKFIEKAKGILITRYHFTE